MSWSGPHPAKNVSPSRLTKSSLAPVPLRTAISPPSLIWMSTRCGSPWPFSASARSQMSSVARTEPRRQLREPRRGPRHALESSFQVNEALGVLREFRRSRAVAGWSPFVFEDERSPSDDRNARRPALRPFGAAFSRSARRPGGPGPALWTGRARRAPQRPEHLRVDLARRVDQVVLGGEGPAGHREHEREGRGDVRVGEASEGAPHRGVLPAARHELDPFAATRSGHRKGARDEGVAFVGAAQHHREAAAPSRLRVPFRVVGVEHRHLRRRFDVFACGFVDAQEAGRSLSHPGAFATRDRSASHVSDQPLRDRVGQRDRERAREPVQVRPVFGDRARSPHAGLRLGGSEHRRGRRDQTRET